MLKLATFVASVLVVLPVVLIFTRGIYTRVRKSQSVVSEKELWAQTAGETNEAEELRAANMAEPECQPPDEDADNTVFLNDVIRR